MPLLPAQVKETEARFAGLQAEATELVLEREGLRLDLRTAAGRIVALTEASSHSGGRVETFSAQLVRLQQAKVDCLPYAELHVNVWLLPGDYQAVAILHSSKSAMPVSICCLSRAPVESPEHMC